MYKRQITLKNISSKAEKRLLIVGSDTGPTHKQAALLETHGYSPRLAHDKEQAETSLKEFDPHIVLIEFCPGSHTGIELFDYLQHCGAVVKCVVQGEFAETDSAVQAMTSVP